MQNKKGLFVSYLIIIFVVAVTVQGVFYLKNKKIQSYKTDLYTQQAHNAQARLQELIEEKRNDTMMLALSFARLDGLKQALLTKSDPSQAVEELSGQIIDHTKFKHPWFQLIDKNGTSIYRSWDKYTNDDLSKVREDLPYFFSNDKPITSISVGKYSMSFKAAIPIFDSKNGFLGIFEATTHFNSIATELKNMQITALFLADKKYKQQLSRAATPNFLDDYFVAQIDPNEEFLNYLSLHNVKKIIESLQEKNFLFIDEIKSLLSYHAIYDKNKIIGHILLKTEPGKLDLATLEEIDATYLVYLTLILLLEVVLFYFLGLFNIIKVKVKIQYIFALLFGVFAFNFIHYKILSSNFSKNCVQYHQSTLNQITNEFSMIYKKNKKLAEFIFADDLNTKEVKDFIALDQREDLYKYLSKKYHLYASMYNIRQLHFHTPDNYTFLRMHKPSEYGDSLQNARQSVVWVNKHLEPFDGFEEGKLFNGFRYIFPLFDEDKKHIGSVEVSFNGYAFVESYLESFQRDRIDFLVKEAIVDTKVMESEKGNYKQSPIKGFLYDVHVAAKLEKNKTNGALDKVTTIINKAKPFWVYFSDSSETVYGIPLVNNISKEVVGTILISEDDIYIKQLDSEKWFYLFIGLAISLLFAFIIYKELLSKQKMLELNQLTLKQRDKAKQISKYKSEFLANMSHEIRTPLNAILGFIDLLKDRIKEPQSREYLQIIDSSSHHLLGVINDILDFSKLENGKLHVEKIDFDVQKEFATIYQLFNAQVSEKNIDLVMHINSNVPSVLVGDPLRIKQVISNLLSNAIKFTPENKKIYLTIDYSDNSLGVSIKDEGIGIEKEKLSLIFEAFSQANSSTTREYGGTGLGLSISSELVRLMGGKLKAKSILGKGSEFYFKIPASEGKLQTFLTLHKQNMSFKGKKILLVEDNKANQVFMKVVLNKLDLAYDIANDGLEAVEMFGNNSYDLILMDENMPNMSGIEATKEILSLESERGQKHTPIIALTANALKGDREKFIDAGMDEYLTKPVDRKKLQAVMHTFFGDSNA